MYLTLYSLIQYPRSKMAITSGCKSHKAENFTYPCMQHYFTIWYVQKTQQTHLCSKSLAVWQRRQIKSMLVLYILYAASVSPRCVCQSGSTLARSVERKGCTCNVTTKLILTWSIHHVTVDSAEDGRQRWRQIGNHMLSPRRYTLEPMVIHAVWDMANSMNLLIQSNVLFLLNNAILDCRPWSIKQCTFFSCSFHSLYQWL